jgi:hypothetical protein
MIAVLWLGILGPAASADDTETFFLGPDGVPVGSLIGTPHGGQMPNYDRGRDLEPGLFLEKSDRGLLESEETRYQHWQAEMTGRRLAGYPTFVVWSASAAFEPGVTGAFAVFLLDCPETALDCTELAGQEVVVPPADSGGWTETTVSLPQIGHVFAEGRRLGMTIVVCEGSDSDMMFAYGFPKYRSRLIVSAEPLVVTVEESVAPPPITLAALDRLGVVKPLSVLASQQGPADINSLTPWLATLTGSTVILVVLGVVLVFTLSPHGRRERSRSGSRPSRSGSRTVTSS